MLENIIWGQVLLAVLLLVLLSAGIEFGYETLVARPFFARLEILQAFKPYQGFLVILITAALFQALHWDLFSVAGFESIGSAFPAAASGVIAALFAMLVHPYQKQQRAKIGAPTLP